MTGCGSVVTTESVTNTQPQRNMSAKWLWCRCDVRAQRSVAVLTQQLLTKLSAFPFKKCQCYCLSWRQVVGGRCSNDSVTCLKYFLLLYADTCTILYTILLPCLVPHWWFPLIISYNIILYTAFHSMQCWIIYVTKIETNLPYDFITFHPFFYFKVIETKKRLLRSGSTYSRKCMIWTGVM